MCGHSQLLENFVNLCECLCCTVHWVLFETTDIYLLTVNRLVHWLISYKITPCGIKTYSLITIFLLLFA